MLEHFWLAFIPTFVAVDPLGLLPIYVGLTAHIDPLERRKIVLQSIITALCVAIGFIFLGKIIFKVLGISMGDFLIAGGGILFCIAIMDILRSGKVRRVPVGEIGAVPIGTPLIAGPAVLTTALIIVDQHGLFISVAAIFINILLVGIVFLYSDILIRLLGKAGASALSKVMALLLAGYAVMMIRRGIMAILS
ncbi:MAG: hypothetical protein A2Z88_03150 [Omnitrophica WOR_2 bacterium GWA2_47_8]|nr:MAG: hypothetical protein A2Z88_03150 [Omnitrophica WOR_2 bacterium GWA2_47_8]